MNLEDQVCSVELAQKLKELNIKQDSVFWWITSSNPTAKYHLSMTDGFNKIYHKEDMLSAFTASELFQMIPAIVDSKQNEPFNIFRFKMNLAQLSVDSKTFQKCYLVNYEQQTFSVDLSLPFMPTIINNIYDPKLSDSLAKLLIKLIEDKIIKVIITE